ncbi:phosphocholine-specific phospholipase C [uncultured Streptomyces sp.]|uniref:phosphocholine-specific phospholipase C n=1 Tax=uncultured Streptomyces sp. TaxID=174707 RepID=UPI0026228FAD|nr:phospholipase C, phosphocholine-specific [uncultured Streptomyces sp.]
MNENETGAAGSPGAEAGRSPRAVSRRTLLGGAVAAGVLGALPLSLRQALAAPARKGKLEDVEHIVVFMQENRSFDHYYGTVEGVRGFGDRTAVRGANGMPVFCQPDAGRAEGWLAPYAMNAAHTSAYQQGAAGFGFGESMNARNGGIADGYVSKRSNGWLGHGYYAPEDMPFYHALASTFTVCDNYHASMETSTNPNREHFMTGTSGGTVRDLAVVDNSEPAAGYEWKTYAERLQDAGVTWKTYQAQDNFDDNALAWFTAFKQSEAGEPLHDRGLGRVGSASQSGDPFAMGDALVAAFAADVAGDTLPQVSWIVAPAALSEHASYAPPNGEHLSARLLAALADNPDVWAKTAFILNYDEHGGFFDHVQPPVPPLSDRAGASTVPVDGEVVVRVAKGTSTYYRVVSQDGKYRVKNADSTLSWSDTLPEGETRTGGPYNLGLGLRVPMTIVSPWTRGGVVDSTVYDHTSVIKLLERRFGVAETNISPWRRAVTGDLTSVFDFSGDEPRWPDLPDTSGNRRKVTDTGKLPAPTVPVPQVFPVQKRGTRTTRPDPYDLRVAHVLREGRLELTLRNEGAVGAVFASYPEPGTAPRHWTVGAGHSLTAVEEFGDDGYDLRVHGPNGYLRTYRGTAADVCDAAVSGAPDGRRLQIDLINRDRRHSHTFLVGDLAYGGGVREVRVKAGHTEKIKTEVAREHWYDVAVTLQDDLRFVRRAAGRLPADGQGVTDPAMGLADPLSVTVKVPAASVTIDESVLVPGSAQDVTVTFAATDEVRGLEAEFVAPAGWTVRTATAPPTRLAAGATATAVYRLEVPEGAAGRQHRLLVTARGRAGDRLAFADGEVSAGTAPVMAGHLIGENFESLTGKLTASAGVLGWTAQAPDGWQVVNAATMPQGTPELQGWSFMTKRRFAVGGQDRAAFGRALGIVAVADPDDWDDTGSAASKGKYDSTLVSPTVALPAGTGRLYLGFHSHYRQEAPQKAAVTAVFDTGEQTRLLYYSADATGNDNAGKDAENALITRDLAVPAGATSVRLEFRMFDAGNNWFWALDNIRLGTDPVTD